MFCSNSSKKLETLNPQVSPFSITVVMATEAEEEEDGWIVVRRRRRRRVHFVKVSNSFRIFDDGLCSGVRMKNSSEAVETSRREAIAASSSPAAAAETRDVIIK